MEEMSADSKIWNILSFDFRIQISTVSTQITGGNVRLHDQTRNHQETIVDYQTIQNENRVRTKSEENEFRDKNNLETGL